MRLKGYDYSTVGSYSVTICVQHRLCLLGEIVDGEMRPNETGRTIERWWRFLPRRFPGMDIDAFVVMPDHMHGIILIGTNPTDAGRHPLVGTDLRVCPAAREGRDASHRQPHLPTILQRFKTITTTDYIAGVNHMDWSPFDGRLWQPRYHDRIVRSDRELDRIRTYIANNPANWPRDDENPIAAPPT